MLAIVDQITTEIYNGWEVCTISKQWLKIYFLPQFGGRIIQIEMNGYPFLFVNPNLAGMEPDATRLGTNGAWLNYGGEKIWPAPQGFESPDQWPGPPDPVLDGGIYAISNFEAEKEGVNLTSPVDNYTGLQISRDVVPSMNTSAVKIKVTLENKSDTTKSWSVWPVCQVDAPGALVSNKYQIICPVNTESKFVNGYKVMHGLANNPQYKSDEFGNLVVDYQYLVGKVGLDANAGWLAYLNRETGKVFVLKHSYQDGESYPDDTSVQIWVQGQGMFYSRNRIVKLQEDLKQNPPYMEMELLSPLRQMMPGECTQFEYEMLAATIPVESGIMTVNEIGIISSPLKVNNTDGDFTISGKYGVFGEGVVSLKYINNETITLQKLNVTPLEGFAFNLFLSEKDSVLINSSILVVEFNGDGVFGVLDMINLDIV